MSAVFVILVSLTMTRFCEKCLFPLNADMISCPAWSKNLRRTLWGTHSQQWVDRSIRLSITPLNHVTGRYTNIMFVYIHLFAIFNNQMNVIHSLTANWIDMQEDLSVKKNLFCDEREKEKIIIPLLVTMCKNLAAKKFDS